MFLKKFNLMNVSRRSRKKSVQKNINISEDTENMDYEINSTMKTFMIKEAFNMFDTDKSSEIDLKEFRKLVLSLEMETDERKIIELYKEIDTNRSGTIDLAEFTNMMLRYQLNNNSPIVLQIENTFSLYDKNGDGYIDEDDLKKVSEELEESYSNVMNDEEIISFISILKGLAAVNTDNINNNDGEKEISNSKGISREEFTRILINSNFLQKIEKEDLEINNLNNNISHRNSRMNINSPNKHNNSSNLRQSSLDKSKSLENKSLINSSKSPNSKLKKLRLSKTIINTSKENI